MVLRKYGHLDCGIVPKISTASSSPSAIAGTSSSQEVQPQSPASVRNKDQTTTLVKEVLCAKNTVMTYGGKRKPAASSSKSASNSPSKMRKSDRRPNKKSKSEGETKNEDQCQAKPCKLVMRKQLFIY
jgi:hypothetical protein